MNNARRTRPLEWLAPAVLAAAFLVAFFATLGHYGMTWDEPENFYTGERNYKVFTTADLDWVSFPTAFEQRRFRGEDIEDYGLELERFTQSSGPDFRPETHSRFVTRTLAFAWPFPPVANIASALTDDVLSRILGVLDPLPAHHAANGLIWAVLVVAAFFFTKKIAGGIAGVVASGTLATAPRLWGPVHNNVKDIPETAMFAFALIALYKGVTERRVRWVFGAGALAGLAVGTKLNGTFVFVIGAIWVAGTIGTRPRLSARMRMALAAAPLLGFASFFATWPYLWRDPAGRTLLAVRYGLDILAETPDRRPGYAAFYALVTTPIPVIILAAIGGLWLVRHRWRVPNRPALLVALWFLVPLLRVNLPGSGFHDGIRQFMEYWPALAIVCGIGAGATAVWLARHVGRVLRRENAARIVAAGAVATFAFAPSVVANIRLHPYEDAYFNELIGGLSGARSADIDWATDYWGNSFLEATRWANAHLERDATILAPIGGHLLRYDGLRDDIDIQYRVPRRAPREPVYLMYLTREERYSRWIRIYDKRRPTFEVKRDGVPLLKAYRMDPDRPPFGTDSS